RFNVARPFLIYLSGVDVRARPGRGVRITRRVVLAQCGAAGVSRLQRHVGRALPVGGIELDADAALVLVLMRIKEVAGQRETVAEVRLERPIDRVTLTLNGGVVKTDVLATHEHAVGLPITVHIDTAVRILVYLRGNRRAVPGSQESIVSARADRVLAMEDHAVLIEALG